MTYRDLICELHQLHEDQLDQDVTVYISGDNEFYSVKPHVFFSDKNIDTLDPLITHSFLLANRS